MTSANRRAAELASTLPHDVLATQTYRPPAHGYATWLIDSTRQSNGSRQVLRKLHVLDAGQDDVEKDPVVEYEVGAGGLGVVRAARQSCLRRLVAIKQVREDRTDKSAEEQLRLEAELMGLLEHPAIPPAHLLGLDDAGRSVLVMKLIAGKTWQEISTEGFPDSTSPHPPSNVRRHIELLIRVGEAVAFAHDKGIIHRDVKPDNVIVGHYGEVYLLDWGIAAQLDADGVYESPGFAGTPAFAAPEMAARKPVLDHRTDVYLLGACLFSVLCGTPPHQGKTIRETIESALTRPTPQMPDALPNPLAEICRKAMAADPIDRYQSASDLLEALRYFLDHGDTIALHAQAGDDLTRLERMVQEQNTGSDDFELIGQRCRYALEQVQHAWPDNHIAREQSQRLLLMPCDDAIGRQRLAAARMLLRQYAAIVEDDQRPRVDTRKNRIDALAEQVVSRPDELRTGIQVMLVERLAAQKKSYDELLDTYEQLRKQTED